MLIVTSTLLATTQLTAVVPSAFDPSPVFTNRETRFTSQNLQFVD